MAQQSYKSLLQSYRDGIEEKKVYFMQIFGAEIRRKPICDTIWNYYF